MYRFLPELLIVLLEAFFDHLKKYDVLDSISSYFYHFEMLYAIFKKFLYSSFKVLWFSTAVQVVLVDFRCNDY